MLQKFLTFSFIPYLVLNIWLVSSNEFKVGNPINILVNKASPFANPVQSYKYSLLPLCVPKDAISYPLSFEDKMLGNSRITSVYQAKFGINTKDAVACLVDLNDRQVKSLRAAVRQNFIFEMFVEDIVVGNVFGYVQEEKAYLNTHLNFQIYYNKQQGKLISAAVSFEKGRNSIDITEGQPTKIRYTYSVAWIETTLTSKSYNIGVNSFFANDSHNLAYFNASLINISLISVVWIILQKINKNEGNYLPFDIEYEKKDSDSNWRSVRLEAFIPPAFKSFLSAAIGTGTQLTLTIISLFILGHLGFFENNQISVIVCGLIIYTLASIVAGISSASYFRYFGGRNSIFNSIFTALYFPTPLLLLTTILSVIAWKGNYSISIPTTTLVSLACIWIFGILPLTILGSLIRPKNIKESSFEFERFSKANRTQPTLEYYKSSTLVILLAGLLSFSALHFELYYLFTAIWTRKIYTMYSSFLAVFILTMNISALGSIAFTYFQLNNKDFRWWWKSFLYGGSCGVYVFLYAIYFYIAKSHMSGFIQLLYYFSYSAIFALVAFLTYGTAGFIGASAFVKHIYGRRKVD